MAAHNGGVGVDDHELPVLHDIAERHVAAQHVKEALYLATPRRYRDECLAGLGTALDPGRPLRDGLALVYAKPLDTYLDGPRAAPSHGRDRGR